MRANGIEGLFVLSEKNKLPIHESGSWNNQLLTSVLERGRQILVYKPNILEYFSHPSGRLLSNVDLEKSHGIYIHIKDGQQFLDLTDHWMTGLLDRYKHPELDDPRYHELLGILAQEKATPTETGSSIQAAFVDMMQGFFAKGIETEKENFQILPVSAGTLAVDDAIYTARGLVAENTGQDAKKLKGLTWEGGFHGRHGEAAEVTTNKKKTGHKDKGDVTTISPPLIVLNSDGTTNKLETNLLLEQSLKQAEEYLSKPEYAYIVVEYPIQAEGGARIINKDALKKLQEICHKHGKVLIVDNVQMGGRSWYRNPKNGSVSPFAEEVIDYADIVAFGKVLHTNGSVINKKNIADKGLNPEYVNQHPLEYGGTHTSTFVDMLSGMMIMSVVLEKELWKNALQRTSNIFDALKYFANEFDGLLSHPRGRLEDTAYLAWSFPGKETRDLFLRLMKENEHIILLAAGDNSVRLAPNPDMNEEEMVFLITAIENQLGVVSKIINLK